MDEWGVALVGLMGAIVGAGVGFVGVVWEHRSGNWSQIRERSADLLFFGEKINDNYKAGRVNPYFDGGGSFTEEPLDDWLNQMDSILRYLELAAHHRTYMLAFMYTANSREIRRFQTLSETQDPKTEKRMSDLWLESRLKFSYHLKDPRRTPPEVLQDFQTKRRMKKDVQRYYVSHLRFPND